MEVLKLGEQAIRVGRALIKLTCLSVLALAAGKVSTADRGIKASPVIQPAAALNIDASRKVALVIGNSDYKHKGQRLSSNPVDDAKAIAKELGDLGFNVKLFTDHGKDDMARRLEEFKKSADGAGVALFYFAGHGVQMGGDNRLIPVDVDMESEFQVKYSSIGLESVLDVMSGAGAKIVVLDACRNNPFKLGGGGGLAAVKGGARTLIAFATAHGMVADDGKPGQHGRYTRHLLNALRKPGLTIVEVFMTTREAVAEDSKGQQVPWDSSSWAPPPLVLRPGPPAATGVPGGGGAASGPLTRGFEPRPRLAGLQAGDRFEDCDRSRKWLWFRQAPSRWVRPRVRPTGARTRARSARSRSHGHLPWDASRSRSTSGRPACSTVGATIGRTIANGGGENAR